MRRLARGVAFALPVVAGGKLLLFPHRLHLVWDLDATLIDTTYEKDAPDADLSFESSSGKHYSVYFRPFAQKTLTLLRHSNDMYMFTAATKGYTDKILDKLVPPGFFDAVLYRDSLSSFPRRAHHRVQRSVSFSKDLRRVGGGSLDLSRAVLIDDKATNQVDDQHILVVRPYDVGAAGGRSHDAEMLRVLGVVTLYNLTGENALTRRLLLEAPHPPTPAK
jgi:TFIIF-interacting CTD phosphatase-like protein